MLMSIRKANCIRAATKQIPFFIYSRTCLFADISLKESVFIDFAPNLKRLLFVGGVREPGVIAPPSHQSNSRSGLSGRLLKYVRENAINLTLEFIQIDNEIRC